MLGNNDAPMQDPQNPMEAPQPPMEEPQGMGGMNDEMGFDNDEDKTEIQSLTGKLSQKLMTYNQSRHDKELSKYVGGMIVPQAAKELDSDEREKLAKKVVNADTSEFENGNGNDMPPKDSMQNQPQPQMESVRRFGTKTLDEIINDVMDDVSNSSQDRQKSKIDKVSSKKFGNNPFRSKFS